MKEEWVDLLSFDGFEHDQRLIIFGALKCRRVVQVRFRKDGTMGFFARVPIPKKVAVLLGGAK